MSLRPSKRASLLVLLAIAMSVALDYGCTECLPPPEPARFYRVTNDREDWVQGSGRVEVTDTSFIISYDTKDGSSWQVEYRRE